MTDAKNMETCEPYRILMMGAIDGELDAEQEARFREHSYQCPECAKELIKYQKLSDLTDSLKLKEPADYEWDRIFSSIFYRIASRCGWVCISAGFAMVLGYLLYQVCVGWDISLILRLGLLTGFAGFAILILSALRQRFRIKKYERYGAVKR